MHALAGFALVSCAIVVIYLITRVLEIVIRGVELWRVAITHAVSRRAKRLFQA